MCQHVHPHACTCTWRTKTWLAARMQGCVHASDPLCCMLSQCHAGLTHLVWLIFCMVLCSRQCGWAGWLGRRRPALQQSSARSTTTLHSPRCALSAGISLSPNKRTCRHLHVAIYYQRFLNLAMPFCTAASLHCVAKGSNGSLMARQSGACGKWKSCFFQGFLSCFEKEICNVLVREIEETLCWQRKIFPETRCCTVTGSGEGAAWARAGAADTACAWGRAAPQAPRHRLPRAGRLPGALTLPAHASSMPPELAVICISSAL